MKNKKFKDVSKVSVVLYVFAIVMLGLVAYNVYTCYAYVVSIVEQGFVVSENLSDVVNYYMTNVTPYAFYAIVLAGLAYVIQKVCYIASDIANRAVVEALAVEEMVEVDADDEEFDIFAQTEEKEETEEAIA